MPIDIEKLRKIAKALKSKYNLGTWDLSDPRILASIAALASGITSVQDNTTTNR